MPAYFEPWERLGKNLAQLLTEKRLQEEVHQVIRQINVVTGFTINFIGHASIYTVYKIATNCVSQLIRECFISMLIVIWKLNLKTDRLSSLKQQCVLVVLSRV